MSLFKDKPELNTQVSIEECCRQYYDCNVFITIADGTEGWLIYLDTAYGNGTEVDQAMLSLGPSVFRKEITALQMELFALAWSHKFEREDFAIKQSVFTRSYLEENNRLDIWDIMLEYNHAISMSGATSDLGDEMDEKHVAKIHRLKEDFREKWLKAKIHSVHKDIGAMTQEEQKEYVCICCVANRIGIDFKKAGVVLSKLITAKLTARLGCENLKPETLPRLAIVTISLYKNAEEYLESVELKG